MGEQSSLSGCACSEVTEGCYRANAGRENSIDCTHRPVCLYSAARARCTQMLIAWNTPVLKRRQVSKCWSRSWKHPLNPNVTHSKWLLLLFLVIEMQRKPVLLRFKKKKDLKIWKVWFNNTTTWQNSCMIYFPFPSQCFCHELWS